MQRIDLVCLIFSPILVGVLLSRSLSLGLGAIAAWNLAAWAPECFLLGVAQRGSPLLQ